MTAEYPNRILLVGANSEQREGWQALLGDLSQLWLHAEDLESAKNSSRINKPDLIIYPAAIAGNELVAFSNELSELEICQLVILDNKTKFDYDFVKPGIDVIRLPEQNKLLPVRARHLLSEKAFQDLVENSLLGHIDPVSGLFNRRMLYDLGEKELNRCQRHNRPFSLAIIKISSLKTINTQFGLRAGDSLIHQISRFILNSIRQSDMLARIGDTEFIILFPECQLAQSQNKLGRLIDSLNDLHPEFEGSKLPFSVTVGASEMDTGDILLEQIIQRADYQLNTA